MIQGYIGLVRADYSEPSPVTGYMRVSIGEVATSNERQLLYNRQVVFDDVASPGYGLITAIGLFDAPRDGNLVYTWDLPEPLDVHEGTIPVIIHGMLIRGVEAKVEAITLNTSDICGYGGTL